MYPPPPTDLIQQLGNNELEAISFGQYVIHLGFENGNKLSFSAPFRFGKQSMLETLPINEFPLQESNLLQILGTKIDDIQSDNDGTLTLEFSNKNILIVYANDPQYEAYTLLIDGKEYVV